MSEIKDTCEALVVDGNTSDLPFRVYGKDTQGNIGYFFTEHHATLFAAAPELLEALTEILKAPAEFAGIGLCQIKVDTKTYRSALEAIAKATGSQS